MVIFRPIVANMVKFT